MFKIELLVFFLFVLCYIIYLCKSNTLDDIRINHEIYLNYVHSKLHEFKEEYNFFKNELQHKKQHLNHCLRLQMEETIQNYVENYGIISERTTIEAKIDTIKYEYKNRLYELAFNQEHPNIVQVKFYIFHSYENLF